MTDEIILRLTLLIIVGILFGIVYSMRVMYIMERRVARIEQHIDKMVHKLLGKSHTARTVRKKRRR